MSITQRGFDQPIAIRGRVKETLVKYSGRIDSIDRVISDVGIEINVIINLLRHRSRRRGDRSIGQVGILVAPHQAGGNHPDTDESREYFASTALRSASTVPDIPKTVATNRATAGPPWNVSRSRDP